MRTLFLTGVMASSVFLGAGCVMRPVVVTQTGGQSFQAAAMYEIGTMIKYEDGLTVRLQEINDSRCKPGVVCIWAGELSPLFTATGGLLGDESKEVRLGTERGREMKLGVYTFSLGEVTEKKAELNVYMVE